MSDKDFFREAAPAELTGPKKVQDANWVGWQAAERRERRSLESIDTLTSEVRHLDRRCAELQAEQHTTRTRNVVGTISIALASIFASVLASAAYANASEGMLVVLGIVTGLFLVVGAAAPWLPPGSHSAATPTASAPLDLKDSAPDDPPEV